MQNFASPCMLVEIHASGISPSGITRTLGAPGHPNRASPFPTLSPLPFSYPLSPPLILPALPISPFPSLTSLCLHILPFLLFPTFPSPSLRPLLLPVGPSRARPPKAFLCNSQPKICKSVKVLKKSVLGCIRIYGLVFG